MSETDLKTGGDAYPFSFSEGLASPDMASHIVGAETEEDRLVRLIMEEINVDPASSAHSIVDRAIRHTLKYGGES